MKKIAVLLTGLMLGAVCLTGCTNNNEAFTQKSYTAQVEEITEVCIDVRDRQIKVTPSADNQIYIEYFENSKEYYNISVSDNHVLTMTAASDKGWTDYIGGKSAPGSRTISLQIPNKLLSTLTLSTTNETISLPALTVTGNISLATNSGNLEFNNLNAGNTITLKTKNGNINGSIIGSYDDYAISCNSKKGECNLPSSKENGTKKLTVSNNNGDVDVEFVSG